MFALIPGLIGLAIYVGATFWAGLRGLWWLALLISLPAMAGGLVSITTDMSQSSSPLFQNFGLLVLGQLAIGAISFWLGRIKGRAAEASSKEFE